MWDYALVVCFYVLLWIRLYRRVHAALVFGALGSQVEWQVFVEPYYYFVDGSQ